MVTMETRTMPQHLVGERSVDDAIGNDGPLHMLYVDNMDQTNVDVLSTNFGMLYTNAHVIESKLAKMLNGILAPQSMYAYILQLGHETYT